MVLCVLASLLAMPTKAMTDESLYEHFIFEAFFTERDYIQYYASKYDAPTQQLLTVAKCESTFSQEAVGDNGKANGIFQYHKPTWDRYSKLMGEELDYYSAHDQAKLTAFVFKNYPNEKRAWTCATKHGIA